MPEHGSSHCREKCRGGSTILINALELKVFILLYVRKRDSNL
ncbi:MAG: hypothetical protein AVDCRST_MAG93-7753 [uncultured Chloroflexia bacterium]|uniref:Uncharacterized protein n=1 Tax=uncultured Chloroflexia bacterium TaxID=1672391 RepID=A0A6J4MNX5_9CHLR|nr:MAG: hypothetical protein AVDCRST_MAG93-7753 [uncultured Chloroflexia bacterium]